MRSRSGVGSLFGGSTSSAVWIDHRDGARQPAHLGQLVVGEGGVLRSAPADDGDVGDRRCSDRRSGLRHDVALGHLVGRLGQHARHVERHIAVADHRHALHLAEVRPVAEIGMAVQPPDEPPRTPDEGQLLARHAEFLVDHHAGGDDHRVVVGLQFLPGNVAADLDIAGEPDIGLGQQPFELPDHRLGALVVGRHAGADQAERRRQAVDQVDAEIGALAQQAAGRIEAAGARANDGNSIRHGGVD